jgi:hypothetical protein
MKDANEVLQQKEAELAHVRREIEGLQIVTSLVSGDFLLKDAYEVLQEKQAELACVRREIEGLQIVAPLLSDELPSASSAEEILDRGPGSEATGTDGLFSSVISNPRATFWKILKRKTS